MDYKVKQIQFAVFLKNFNLSDKIKLATDLKIKTGNVFDGEPTILPLPIDAPIEIPRIILQSRDGKYTCNVSLQRADLFFNLGAEGESDITTNIARAKEIAIQIATYFNTDISVSIGRIGFVTTFVATATEVANLFIKEKLLTNSKLVSRENLRTISVVVNDQDTISGYDISRIIQIGSLQKPDRSASNDILILCDSNTVVEKFQDYNLSVDAISNILSNISTTLTPEKFGELFEVTNVAVAGEAET